MAARPVLVTGATGLLGRPLVAQLQAAGRPVRILSRRPCHWPGIEVVVGDLTRPRSLAAACAGVHTLFHLASHRPDPATPDPERGPRHHQVTLLGTRHLVTAAEAAGVERLIFASSTRVLDGADSDYARAKGQAERLLAESSLATASLRLPPLYGAPRGFIADLVRLGMAGRLPSLPDFGERRSLLHVEDAATALRLAADRALEGAWTVTDLETYALADILAAIRQALGLPARRPWPRLLLWSAALGGELAGRLLRRPMPLDLARLEKLRRDAWYDGRPFARAAGFTPRHDLHGTLPSLIRRLSG